jgi:UPF0716 protein FxsA
MAAGRYTRPDDTLPRVFLAGVLIFVAAEIAAFVAVGLQIGFGWAVLLLIGLSALGPFAVRRVGLGVLTRTQERLAAGEVPTRQVLDGVLILAGGAMICLPGFISGALGLLLMVGAVRDVVVRTGGYWLGRRVTTLRPGRWTATDVDSRPITPVPPDPVRTSERMIWPGDHGP